MLFGYSKSKRPEKSFLIFAGVLFLDQCLKYFFLASGTAQKNYAALLGFETRLLFSITAMAALLLSLFLFLKPEKDRLHFVLPLALILAGIFSNTIDKLRMGFIVDYITLGDMCIFNLADIAIASGTIFLIWRIIKE